MILLPELSSGNRRQEMHLRVGSNRLKQTQTGQFGIHENRNPRPQCIPLAQPLADAWIQAV